MAAQEHAQDKTLPLFQKIGEICNAANNVNSTDELLSVSLKKILNLFDAQRGSIFIFNEGTRHLELHTAIGMKIAEQKKMIKQMGQGIVGRVAESKQPIVVGDIANDERFSNFRKRKNYQTASFICVPLMTKDRLVGVINITDKHSGEDFTNEEMQILDFLSSQIALNYLRVQLYQNFETVVKEKQDLKTRLGRSDQEAQYLKKQIHIQEKLATIGKLAGGIAHEFNNPLDGVMRYTNLCLEQTKDNEVLRGYLLEIKHGLNRMANIVRNLLACSRNETPQKERLEFSDSLQRVLAGLQMEISKKRINIHNDVEEGLPSLPDLGLERVLTNLIHNAIDAIKDSGSITIKARQNENTMEIVIQDTGVGIPSEHMEQIFDPFFTTKDLNKGCGLGLTIVGEVVKAYNGKINVHSSVNQGTTFFINIPLNGVRSGGDHEHNEESV